jgi:hypothetical protein
MLADKPKLVFTDIAGKVTYETRLPYQHIKQAEKPTPEQQYLKALYNVGEAAQ